METKNLCFSYDKEPVIKSLSFEVAKHKITTVMGANGSGKTTLFNLLTKNLKPKSGEIFLNGKDLNNIGLKDFAKEVAIVHQNNTAPPDIKVRKLVEYGRLPYSKPFARNSEEDEKKIEHALEITGLSKLKDKEISQLSGGQRQRVWIAMAIAQDPKMLLLDEPTTFLDIRYQIQILEMVKKLNREFSMTILMILHDINQAIAYSDEIIGLHHGELVARGRPEDIIDEQTIEKLYDINLEIIKHKNKKVVLTSI